MFSKIALFLFFVIILLSNPSKFFLNLAHALPIGSLQFFKNGEYFEWKNGDLPMKYAQWDEPIVISGTVDSVNDCGTFNFDFNDRLYVSSDIYIIKTADLHDGEPLKDVSGDPNTMIGSSTNFDQMTIGYAPPDSAMENDIPYSIVYDECQNGRYDANQDTVFKNAIIMHVPAILDHPECFQLPSHIASDSKRCSFDPGFAKRSDEIAAAKGKAETAKVFAYAVLGSLTASAWYFRTSVGKLIQKNCLDFITSTGWAANTLCEAVKDWGKKGIAAVTTLMLAHAVLLIKKLNGLTSDPPDNNYKQVTTLSPANFTAEPGINDTTSAALSNVTNANQNVANLIEAFVHSVERYNGAINAADPLWIVKHAYEVKLYSQLLSEYLPQAQNSISSLIKSLRFATQDAKPENVALSIKSFQDSLSKYGINNEGIQNLKNLGYTDAQIEQTKNDFLSMDSNSTTTTDYMLSTLQKLNDSFGSLKSDMGNLSATMDYPTQKLMRDNTGIVNFSMPIADPGGPYLGLDNKPITLNGTKSLGTPSIGISNTTAIVDKYEWDLNGDGLFNDAVGPTPTYIYSKPYDGLIGLRVTNNYGNSDVSYSKITINKVNNIPIIRSFSPLNMTNIIIENSSQLFQLSVYDPDRDPLSINWFVDGKPATSLGGNTFEYKPSSAHDIGLHRVEANITDISPTGQAKSTVTKVWYVAVLAADKDNDGWNANVDCNDANPSINPGMKEIIGNGKDDDCNPNTPDNGRPPVAIFSPQSTEERNVALLEAGAQVINSTGSPSTLTPPSNMLDYSNSTSDFPWLTKPATNQWAKILLAGLPQNKAVGGYVIDKIKVMPFPDKTSPLNVRDFEIAVSNSTSADSAFKTVFHGTVLNNAKLQEFVLPKPVLAKYVKYSPLNNYGGTTNIQTEQLKIMTAQQTSNHTISFKNLSTDPDNDIVSWNWNFGDKSANSTEMNPVHTFPTGPGIYNVTLTAVDSTGQSSKFSTIQKILSGPPNPSFIYTPNTPNEGSEVTFTDKSSADPDGGKVIYRKWDWGDKTISAGILPTTINHIFPDNGLYPVRFTIVDDQEEASQVTRFVQVLNVPPRVVLGSPQTIYDGASLLIQPSIIDPAISVDNLTYQWDFGDGSPVLTQKNSVITHQYTLNDPADSTQKFNATLTATDKDGGVGKATKTIIVNPDNQGPKPPANATILLTDNFNREDERNPVLCYTAACSHLLNWDVKKGSVDVIGINSFYDFQPGYGLYIDLDGSGTGPGKLVSKKTFSLTPGNYTLQFDLAGSFRGDTNKVIVSLGNLYNESFTLPSNSPFQTIKRNIVVNTPTNASLIFDHYDVSPPTFDTFGLLLDNVKLYSTDPKVKNLNHAPIARNDSATTKEDVPVAVNVLSNDTDIDNDPLHTAKIIKQPLHGTAYINTNDTVTYGPNPRFFGKDSFVYEVSDGLGGNANGTVSVTVNHVNHIPKAIDSKNIVTNEDTPITAILNGNDDDLTHNETSIPLKFSIVNAPTSGTLSSISAINSTSARITYTPNLHLYGNDKFTFKVNDGIADSTNVGTVPITVNHINHPPITNDKNISTKAGIPVNITLTAADIDKDPLAFYIVNAPTSGTLSNISAINSTSAYVTYTPVNLTFVGNDTFSYRVSDGKGGNATAAVNIKVRPSNIPPIANNLTISTAKNKPVNFTLTGSDADRDPLTFVGLTAPHNGFITLNSTTGLAEYTPLRNYHGSDNFTFAVNDGKAISQSANVMINVNDDNSNDPPRAVSEHVSTYENKPININVLANDIDPNHDPLSIKNIIDAFHGSATINQNNDTVNYKPNHNFVGRDAFAYNVTDGRGGISAAQTIVDVLPVNQPPIANDRTISVNETNKPISVTLFGTDPEGSPLTFSIVSNPSVGGMLSSVRPINGTSANVTFTPKTNFSGTDSFTYKANDGALDSNVATIKIDINPIFINHPPIAVNDKATTNENTSVNINVLANDTDIDHDLLKVTGITTQPKNGDAVFNANNNTITYTPANSFFGQDTFTYEITDGHPGGTATATVTITVDHINRVPIANAGPDQIVNENTTNVTLNGTGSSDPDTGDTMASYSWKQVSGTPIVALTGANTATPTFTAPSVTADTTLEFNLIVTDNHGATSKPDTVAITIKNVNLPPIANAGTDRTVNENTTGVILDGSASSDKDGTIKSYNWTQTSGPPVSLTGANTSKATFTAPSVAKDTTLTFKLAVTDNDNATSSATTNVIVKNVNIPPIANAGANQTVNENTTGVTLSASKSYDPDGKIVSYLWSQTSGPTVVLSNPNSATTTFTAPSVTKDTSLTFSLTVKDDGGANSNAATVTVLVKNVNLSPIANAGTDQTINENTTGVKLDGAKSFDRDGTIVSYSWTQTAGPTVALTGDNTATPTFTAPSVTKDTTLTFKLVVTDNNDASSTNTAVTNVLVKNVNILPVANAGTNQTVNENTTGVKLDGSKSFDKDGTITSYKWQQIAGPTVTLSSPNSASTTFTAPSVAADTTLTFKLIVTDNNGASSSSTTTVIVKNVNLPPVANAGADQTVNEGTANLKLDGTKSYDPDKGDTIASYSWTQSAGPTVTLTGATTATPTFTAPQVNADTTLTFSLKITDNHGAASTNTATTNVLVKNVNQPPIAKATVLPSSTVNGGTVVTLDGSGSNDPDGKIASYNWVQTAGSPTITLQGANTAKATFTAPSNLAADTTYTFKLTVADNGGASSSATINVLVKHVNQPPVAIIAGGTAGQVVNSSQSVTLDGSKSYDPDGKITSYQWVQTSGSPTVTLTGANTAIASFKAPIVNKDTTLTFKLTVADNGGASSSGTTNIKVKQTGPICNPPAVTSVIWPPNHNFVSITVQNVKDPDGDPVAITITKIMQDEPVNSAGSGNTSPDGSGVGTNTAHVRAEREGNGDGRVYHIYFTASDGKASSDSGTCSGQVLVSVPHDQAHQAVDQGPLYDSTVMPSANKQSNTAVATGTSTGTATAIGPNSKSAGVTSGSSGITTTFNPVLPPSISSPTTPGKSTASASSSTTAGTSSVAHAPSSSLPAASPQVSSPPPTPSTTQAATPKANTANVAPNNNPSPSSVAPSSTQPQLQQSQQTPYLYPNQQNLYPHQSQPQQLQPGIRGVNQPPLANAGISETVYGGSVVMLDGRNSYDPDNYAVGTSSYGTRVITNNGIAAYQWTQVPTSGGIQTPMVILQGDSTATPTFVAPVLPYDVTLAFSLKVMDSDGGAVSSNPVIVYVLIKHNPNLNFNNSPTNSGGSNNLSPNKVQPQQQQQSISPSQPNSATSISPPQMGSSNTQNTYQSRTP